MQNTEFFENIINGYRLSSFLGSGGMGDVWLGIHTGTGHKVAVKILNNPEFEQRFRNEMEALARIQHPAVTSFYEIGKIGQKTCIIMEYAPGLTLHELIRRQGKLSYEQAKSIFSQMLQGVGYVHSNNIVHRDIKPANIKVDEAGQVKILDFGIAKGDFSEHLTHTGEAIGTMQYMSPEQLRGQPDKRSDVWSLGVTFYEMLTGYLPFNSKELYTLKEQIRKGQYTPVTTMNNTVPPHIEKVIARCLKLNPDHRYQSTEELLYDLDNTASGKTKILEKITPSRTRVVEPPKSAPQHPSGAPPSLPRSMPAKAGISPLRIILIFVAPVLLLAGIIWWINVSDEKLGPNKIGVSIESLYPGTTISINGKGKYDLPHTITGRKGQKVIIVAEREGCTPRTMELDFGSYRPGEVAHTQVNPVCPK